MKNRCRWNSVFITGISMLTSCSEPMCRTEMSLNYQIRMQLYVDFCHIVQKVVLVFFFSLLSGASSVFFSTRRYKITCKVLSYSIFFYLFIFTWFNANFVSRYVIYLLFIFHCRSMINSEKLLSSNQSEAFIPYVLSQ